MIDICVETNNLDIAHRVINRAVENIGSLDGPTRLKLLQKVSCSKFRCVLNMSVGRVTWLTLTA